MASRRLHSLLLVLLAFATWMMPAVPSAAPNVPLATVIEYYNASTDHYFITWVPDEIAELDSGRVIKGWARTGQHFSTYTSAQSATSPVCRYYIPPPWGDSHFYGRDVRECAATGQNNPGFVLEDAAFMNMFLPVAGACLPGTIPLYRVFDNRSDINHRYVADRTIRDAMLATGWMAEGDGPNFVAMCAPACIASITTEFSGNLNATYDGGSGSGGGDGGGGGGAGAGGGEGKVLGALMTMNRLSDGALLGSALTDSVNGLVTITACPENYPVLLTLSGRSGARYYDEGIGDFVDFGTDRVLHALVDKFDENVGVSALTEAAYRYALNRLGVQQGAPVGQMPVKASGNVTGLTLQQVQEANAVVLNEINRSLTTDNKLVTIKSLPTPIDNTSPVTALPKNRYGLAASITGGLARNSAHYLPSSRAPGLDGSEQLARDLTDGKLDGFAADGTPAASTASTVAYDAVRFPLALNVGANSVAERFGATTTFEQATLIAELTEMAALSGVSSVCSVGGDSAALLKDGTISVARTTCANQSSVIRNFAKQVKLVEGSGAGQVPRTFFVKTDGTVWGWGEATCGLLGNGETMEGFYSTPVQLPGIQDVTSIALGSYFNLARSSDGAVYSWGINYYGELGMGLGEAAAGSVNCQNDFLSGDFRHEAAVATPTRVDGLRDVITVATDLVTGFALDRGGRLFQWGLIPIDYDFSAPQPNIGIFDAQPFPVQVTGLPKVVAMAVSYYMKMALVSDGSVWGWGPNVIGNFGDGTLLPHLAPTPVPGLTKVVEIAASVVSPFVALLQDGTIRYWGGCCTLTDQSIPPYIMKTPTAPAPGNTPIFSNSRVNSNGTLPPIRHVSATGGKVLIYAADGSIYQFPKSDSEQVFVLIDASVFNP